MKKIEIDRYEVSQEEWQKIMEIKEAGLMQSIPVEGITFDDAQAFMQRLNDRHDGYHYRRTTEAQCEYAARGVTDTPHGASGDVTAWHRENSNRTPHPVCFFSSRRRHTNCLSDWSSDVCSSDLRPGSSGSGR